MTGVPERVLARVVLPHDRDVDVLPLYVDGEAPPVLTPTSDDDTALLVPPARTQHPDQVLDRRRYVVPAGTRTSFATYHNAFPASYWQRWSRLTSVRLRVRTEGTGTLLVYRSTARGAALRVDAREVSGAVETVVDLPLDTFVDGGWYWFDLVAGLEGLRLEQADWTQVAPDGTPPATVTITITTFNRPAFCLDLLRQLAVATGPDGELTDLVDQVLVVDQGTKRLSDHGDFAAVQTALASRLRVVPQRNLGGSGGFSRGMLEALDGGRSGHVLLLDDDVVIEPEGIARALAFADLARRPLVVGGHMFSMYARSVLHAFSETVARRPFTWQPAGPTQHDHDLSTRNLRGTPWLHRRVDAGYTGWWMCLLPVEVLREVGLSLPFFIKWDDAEYGLRARAHGVPTVSLPGAAVWHVPWTDKDDSVDWQAYYHARNRVVAALLHSPFPHGGRLLADSMAVQVKHVVAQQYSAAELRIQALEDVLAGPHHLHGQLGSRLAELTGTRRGFTDARVVADVEDLPAVREVRPRRREDVDRRPGNRVAALASAAVAVARQALPANGSQDQPPQRWLAAPDAGWWSIGRLDSVLVSTTDGTGASWHRRDRAVAADLLRRSAAVHARLHREWPQQAVAYRAALPSLVSPQAWRETLDVPAPDAAVARVVPT
ncbi:glycosyltransferase [Angustibacter luteus]|uniref:Glycosyltransferase n=1 Tax=Angustibacter luteus TaxID=658456 RepID=A0ABW1JDB7_9ACTN